MPIPFKTYIKNRMDAFIDSTEKRVSREDELFRGLQRVTQKDLKSSAICYEVQSRFNDFDRTIHFFRKLENNSLVGKDIYRFFHERCNDDYEKFISYVENLG